MNAKILILILLPAPLLAQGFAGLGTDTEGFRLPSPDTRLEFPADHGAHPDFRVEWWYVTANLVGADGQDYGAQWTLFRTAVAPEDAAGWRSPQIWFAHAAVTARDEHLAAETYARGGIGQAGVSAAPFAAWINDWQMLAPQDSEGIDRLTLSAAGDAFSYDLTLAAEGPLVPHGDAGYSVKSEQGQASHYYSQPFYRAQGALRIGDRDVAVEGQAWLDREWSSQPLSPTQSGWDWLSLHFDDGGKLMVFRLRDNAAPDYISATWADPDGETTRASDGKVTVAVLETTRSDSGEVPVSWRITWPEKGVDIRTRALNPKAWMPTSVPYWEGPVRFEGSATGRGYVEMTGYEDSGVR